LKYWLICSSLKIGAVGPDSLLWLICSSLQKGAPRPDSLLCPSTVTIVAPLISIIRLSELSRSVDKVSTDVSEEHMRPIFNGQQDDVLTLETQQSQNVARMSCFFRRNKINISTSSSSDILPSRQIIIKATAMLLWNFLHQLFDTNSP
jgi:hypothetical protein